jgi:hypothetical protein
MLNRRRMMDYDGIAKLVLACGVSLGVVIVAVAISVWTISATNEEQDD